MHGLAISVQRPKEDGLRYPKIVGNGRGGETYHRPPHAPLRLQGRVGFSIILKASFADSALKQCPCLELGNRT